MFTIEHKLPKRDTLNHKPVQRNVMLATVLTMAHACAHADVSALACLHHQRKVVTSDCI